ncbi:MAG: Rieske (2Fe-2S) protein [Acidobacteriota bacterium]
MVSGRRSILQWLGRIFLSLWGVGFVAVVLSFLKVPKTRMERAGGQRTLRAGALDDLAVGAGLLIRHGAQPILVVRPRPDQLVALSGICTHLRCVLRWDGERSTVVCPCHAGAFDLNGNVLSGPPNQPLKSYQAEVRGGVIYVHL